MYLLSEGPAVICVLDFKSGPFTAHVLLMLAASKHGLLRDLSLKNGSVEDPEEIGPLLTPTAIIVSVDCREFPVRLLNIPGMMDCGDGVHEEGSMAESFPLPDSPEDSSGIVVVSSAAS